MSFALDRMASIMGRIAHFNARSRNIIERSNDTGVLTYVRRRDGAIVHYVGPFAYVVAPSELELGEGIGQHEGDESGRDERSDESNAAEEAATTASAENFTMTGRIFKAMNDNARSWGRCYPEERS